MWMLASLPWACRDFLRRGVLPPFPPPPPPPEMRRFPNLGNPLLSYFFPFKFFLKEVRAREKALARSQASNYDRKEKLTLPPLPRLWTWSNDYLFSLLLLFLPHQIWGSFCL